ncbi:MAG: hypothetical protein LBO06_02050 [Bacteroidales bacterium]|jgi:hypothetical protein|nr:hypothetical protein [Bacteroidales bacterium]
MKTSIIVALSLLSLSSFSCKGQPQSSYVKIDTIVFPIKDFKPPQDSVKINIQSADTLYYGDTSSVCQADSFYHLTKYVPVKCKLKFTDIKPDKGDSKQKLCVAAAFTSKELIYVVGDYVTQGRFVGQEPDVESGYCVIINGRPVIRPLDNQVDKYIIRAVETKGDFFRQMLLIYDYEVVQCTIFDKYRPTYRRALVEQGKGQFFVVESEERISICDFQTMLVKLGVKNAIYLDMGTWSEGFYRDRYNEVVPIGKQTLSTKHQTNWLVFEQIK